MKKNFKNSFGVTSDFPEMIEAFKKWAESIGWKHDNSSLNFPESYHKFGLHFNGTKNNGEDGSVMDKGTFRNVVNDNTFSLPSQWNEAMQAASEEVEEPKPEFKRGEKVICECGCGAIVLCSGDNNEEEFGGMCIVAGEHNTKGDYSTIWTKHKFIPHPDPVTI